MDRSSAKPYYRRKKDQISKSLPIIRVSPPISILRRVKSQLLSATPQFVGDMQTVEATAGQIQEDNVIKQEPSEEAYYSVDEITPLLFFTEETVKTHSLLQSSMETEPSSATTSPSFNPSVTVAATSKMKNDDLGRFELGQDCFVVVSPCKGGVEVHIKEYAQSGSPTKKGICLSPSLWATLIRSMSSLSEAVLAFTKHLYVPTDCKYHIGGGVYATIDHNYPCVNIREYFVPDSQQTEIPTKRGIELRFSEIHHLQELIDELNKLSPDLMNATPCSDALDPANLSGYLACHQCNPTGDLDF